MSVDSLMISSVEYWEKTQGVLGALILVSRQLAAAMPSCSLGVCMVVSGGLHLADWLMSSKPTKATSSGIRCPRNCMACMTCMAVQSLPHI